jgi:hypothetical protein
MMHAVELSTAKEDRRERDMSKQMKWERVRFVGRQTLDYRSGSRRRDRADAWLMTCFQAQRASAKQRGVPFAMTYEEWLGVWQQSGKLRERGTGTGHYVMGRRGDVGGYASSNVAIIGFEENLRQGIANWKVRQALTAASTDTITASSTAAVPW